MMKRGEGGAHESQTAWDEIVEPVQHTEARNTQVSVGKSDRDDLFIVYYKKATFLIYYTLLK